MGYPRYAGVDYEWFMTQMVSFIGRYNPEEPDVYLSTLPEWRAHLFYVGQALTAIMNGGINGYLTGPFGEDVNKLPEVLEKIGAKKLLKTILTVMHLFPSSEIPISGSERLVLLDEICKNKNVKKIDDLIIVDIDSNIWNLIRRLEPAYC